MVPSIEIVVNVDDWAAVELGPWVVVVVGAWVVVVVGAWVVVVVGAWVVVVTVTENKTTFEENCLAEWYWGTVNKIIF